MSHFENLSEKICLLGNLEFAEAFFDIRVFDPNACRHLIKSLQQCHAMKNHEKKRSHNELVLQVNHGTLTPLVFSLYGSMGRECDMFYSWLSQLISDKRNLLKSITMNWIRTKVCFALLKLSLLCLRGSRTVSNVTLNIHSNMPKFELYNSNIFACPCEKSLSHLHYYICNFSNPFITNVRPI